MVRRARPKSPVRTCVGCRRRAAQADLLRVVARAREARWFVVADREHRLPGRGAYLHPREQCLQLAESRRAFNRALRLNAPLDLQHLHTEIIGAID